MSTPKKILHFIFLGLMGLIAVPFMFIEFWNLFSFEFVNTNDPFFTAFSYLSRGMYFFLIFTLSVFTILFIIGKKKFCIILFATGVALFIGALLSLLFYEYYISLIIIFATLVQLIIISIGFFKKEKQACFIANKQ